MAGLTGLLVLTGCNAEANQPMKVQPMPTTTTTKQEDHRAVFLRAYHRYEVDVVKAALWYQGVERVAETVNAQVRTRQVSHPPRVTVSVSSPSSGIAGVMQCIKAHESGNYSESSHISSGSGAFQWIPSSWQSWSARAGLGGYRYAYEAPPTVQDAVTSFALTHGGSQNWSNRFGFDPCTQGMG